MTLPVLAYPLTSPEIGYELVQHHSPPFRHHHPNTIFRFTTTGADTHFGIFPSLLAAQSARSRAIMYLTKKARDTNDEKLLSEFVIKKVDVWQGFNNDPIRDEEALFAPKDPKDKIAVKMPRQPKKRNKFRRRRAVKVKLEGETGAPGSVYKEVRSVFEEERRPSFAKTREPLWSRRDELPWWNIEPIRYVEYVRATELQVQSKQWQCGIMRIVAEQPDELADGEQD